jgi:hypothetical protein
MLGDHIFKTIVDSTPLVSIDILLKRENKVLLESKQVHKYTKDYFRN